MPRSTAGAACGLALIAVVAGPGRGVGVEYAYVTTERLSAVDVIDTAVGAVVGQIALDIGDRHVALSADGRLAYTIDFDRSALVEVDLAARTVLRRMVLSNTPRRIALTADGRTAYVAGAPGLEVDLASGAVTPLTAGFTADVALTADDARVLFAVFDRGDDSVALLVFDRAARALIPVAPQVRTQRVVLSPDRQSAYVMAVRNTDETVRQLTIDVATLAIVADVVGGTSPFGTSPDGHFLYAFPNSFTPTQVVLVEAATARFAGTIDLGLAPSDAVVAGDVVAALGYNERVLVLADAHGAAPRRVALGGRPYSLAAAPDGATVTVATDTGLRIVDVATGAVVGTLPAGGGATGLAATADGARLIVANYGTGSVSIVDTARRVVTASIFTGGAPFGVALTPDERRAYVSSYTGRGPVYVIDLETNVVLDAIEVAGQAAGIAVTPDGRRVLVAGHLSSLLSVIDVMTDQRIDEFRVFDGPTGVAMRADGHAWVALESPSAIQLVDVAGDGPRLGVSIPFDPLVRPCAVASSRDGTRAYVAGMWGIIAAVDVPARLVLGTAHIAAPFSPDSCGIALSTDERTVYVANHSNDLVTVLAAADMAVIDQIPVSARPFALAIACPGGCPTPTATATVEPTATRTPVACVGDCHGDGEVSIADLVLAVRIATAELSLASCVSIDADADGGVGIDELVGAVIAALQGCGS